MTPILALIALQAAGLVPTCRYDRAALLALGLQAFDQDMTGGWRSVENAGCDLEAADLIRDWRTAHRAISVGEQSLLVWHEGQLRANAGQTSAAIALFEQSRKTPHDDHGFGWNLYVDGSVAFLKRDRTALAGARAKLAVLPKPAGLVMKGPDGKPVKMRWPLNLNVLDGFQRCWGQTYKQAYSCGVPMTRVIVPEK